MTTQTTVRRRPSTRNLQRFLCLKKTPRVFDRVDVFGNQEVVRIEDDRYFGCAATTYEIYDGDPRNSDLLMQIAETPQGLKVRTRNNFEDYLDSLDPASKLNYLERLEEKVQDELGLEYPSDVELVESVEEILSEEI